MRRFLHAPAFLRLKKVSPQQACVIDRELSVSKIQSGGGDGGGGGGGVVGGGVVGSRAPITYWTSSIY